MSKASMACSPFSRLLRSSIRKKAVCSSGLTLSILQARPSCFFNDSIFRNSPFSTSASPSLQSEDQSTRYPDVKSSLSARMSFVFDQIDALDREKKEKDETLQRIRAWRENKQKKDEPVLDTDPSVPVSSSLEDWVKKDNLFTKKEVELVHPWSEWVEFMEQLVRQNYFDHRRKDEDQIMRELGCDEVSGFAEEGFDFTRDWTTVRTACLNFGRDRFDLLRSLSRKDIQILVGSGCPSTDSKVVFSSKVLRKHAHLDEGDVCSSCNLRSTCNRGFLLTRKEDEARTLDLIRVLLTFGFDPINGSVENKPLMKLKPVKTVARKLLHEIVKLSSVPIDPNLPPPEIKRPPPKIKQPPPQPKKRVGRDDIEMKKGDWLCPKCDFMNFAKNVVCLQCDAKRPKRQLLPGEWECPECNFLNYRRNVVCFHCEHKRPPDDYIENRSPERANVSRARMSDASRIPGITDSYNFDFDDDESDGAEVAAFEFADSPKTATGPLLDDEAASDGFEGQSFEARGMPRQPFSERGRHAEQVQMTESSTRMGFDDFDDEEEDDVNSYEIDTSNNTYSKPKTSSRTLSDYEESSGSEDSDDSALNIHSHRPMRKRAHSVSDVDDLDCDSDEELPNRSFQRSANIASSRKKSNIRGRGSYSRSFVSDDEFGLNSDSDDDMGESYTHKWNDGRKSLSSKGPVRLSESEDGLSFGSESEDGDDSHFHRKARNKAGSTTSSRYRSNSGGDMRSTRDAYPRHDRGGSLDGFHDNNKNNGVARGGRYNEKKMTGRGYGASGSYKPGQGGYGNRERGKFDESRGRYNEQRMAGRSGSSSGSYRPGQGAGYGNRGDRGNGRSSGFGDRLGRGNANDRPRDRFGRGNANDRPRDRLGRGNANDGPRRRIIER